jgi:alcohol dehydrogenase
MRALQLISTTASSKSPWTFPEPEAPGPGEVTLARQGRSTQPYRRLGLARHGVRQAQDAAHHWRGSIAGVVEAIGPGVSNVLPGQLVSIYGARTCGLCKPCREKRDNLCEHVGGVHGFHLDGFAQEKTNLPARLLVPAPPGMSMRLRAALRPSPSARSSTCCSTMPSSSPARRSSCMPAALGSARRRSSLPRRRVHRHHHRRLERQDRAAKALGADHVINYRDRSLRGRRAQADEEEGRRRRLRTCRQGYLGRLDAVAEARRAARHLRLHLGRLHRA